MLDGLQERLLNAFWPSFDVALSPSPSSVSDLSHFISPPVRRRSRLLTGVGTREWGRSQIIRRRESLVLYNPLTTLLGEVRRTAGRTLGFFVLFLDAYSVD
jgi:hypothetical protein